jgi:hypothetical protein
MPPLLLFISYEFTLSPFSGNGVLARSLVKGLLLSGIRVLVVCAEPNSSHAGRDHPITTPELSPVQEARLHVLPVRLSEAAGWRRLDAHAAHEEFAAGGAHLAERVASEEPLATISIDWTGGGAWAAMRDRWPNATPPPCLYIVRADRCANARLLRKRATAAAALMPTHRLWKHRTTHGTLSWFLGGCAAELPRVLVGDLCGRRTAACVVRRARA